VVDVRGLASNALNGDKLALSKLLTCIELNPEVIKDVADLVWPKEHRAHVIGVTGSAGVGKSTLISVLADELASDGHLVAVIAVDPSSPITGGAFLGDRVRMVGIRNSDKVFIRSMSTGSEEALPLKALLSIEVMDALGYDYIILETPGIGQFNVGIANIADTVILVLIPGAGDEIQALKAGIMEVGDIYVINKADRPNADVTFNQVVFALGDVSRDGWVPKVLKVSALQRLGIKELVSAVSEHRNYLISSNKVKVKEVLRRSLELELIMKYRVMNMFKETLNSNNFIRNIYESCVRGSLDPITATDKIFELMFKSVGKIS
jgi:LAO/AO transport system kinase